MQIKSTISYVPRMTKKGNKCERRCRASTTGVDGKHDGINTLGNWQF